MSIDAALDRLRAVAAEHGKDSAAWAGAMCGVGAALVSADEFDRAADCFRQAAAVRPRDHEARKNQLTYRTNYGVALGWAGRHREAEKELRRVLRERLDFYGRDHPGYAYGLEPLADLMWRRNKLTDARPLAEEAVAILRVHLHETLPSALALRAAIVEACGTGEPLFPDLYHLPDEMVAEVGIAVARMDGSTEPLLVDAVAALSERIGAGHPATGRVLVALARFGGGVRTAAMDRVLAAYPRQEDALAAELALAAALPAEQALPMYASAHTRAQRLGSPEQCSEVLRQWGLALRDAGQFGPAESKLTEARVQGRRGSDNETLGRAAVALGIFLHHQERLDEAEPALREGLAALEPLHRDAVIGGGHLRSVRAGEACGCDPATLAGSMADAFREFVLARLPADLLDRLDVSFDDDGELQIGLRLSREVSEEELNHLNTIVSTAHEEFRRRLS